VLERVSIGSLPDDVLLEIFYQVRLVVSKPNYTWHLDWPKLVQVCRRWRFVIFASPLHLKLQIYCTPNTPVRKLLNIWPTFPLVVSPQGLSDQSVEDKFDNLIAALEHRDRVQKIDIGDQVVRYSLWERIMMVMQGPFPELTHLDLEAFLGLAPPVPNTFLTGSASRLQHLHLRRISFPSLPRLLLSTRRLTHLHLIDIPNSGYIPPERMATCLSVLPKLEFLVITFQSPTPHPKRRNRPLPPQTRSVLSALTSLVFQGISEYFEVLAARIDAPLLRSSEIAFFNQLVFDIPQTIRFFGHLDSFRTASLTFSFRTSSYTRAVFFPSNMPPGPLGRLVWCSMCSALDKQVSSLAQICSQIMSFRSSVESLVIESNHLIEIDNTPWLQLFHSFPSVQSLRISLILEQSIAAALQGLTGESAAEVFPSLHSLSIVGVSDEATPQGIQPFLTARQHCGRPIAISRRDE
jgi:F-box-like